MSTKQITLQGKAYWAKVWESNREMFEYDPSTNSYTAPTKGAGKYVLTLELSDPEAQRIRETGARAAEYMKTNENGNYTIKLSREHEKRDRSGKLLEWASGAPTITGVAKDTPIGNDSDITVTVSVYGKKPMVGCRLDTIHVNNLVSYIPDPAPDTGQPFPGKYEEEVEVPF